MLFFRNLLFCFLCLAAWPFSSRAGDPALPVGPELPAGPDAVGYRVLHLEDHTRSFGDCSEQVAWRPMQIHLWFPAEAGTGQSMHYRDYVAAATPGGTIDKATQTDPATAAATWKASPLRRGADETRLETLLNRPVAARRDAEPAQGPFPLIVYSPSINSDPLENAMLFEYLSSHGYVVAAAPSLGKDEPEVSRDVVGAEVQRNDLAFVLSHLSFESYVDVDAMGAMGFSWGGMSALLLALDHGGLRAIACLDGGMRFPEYLPVAADFASWDARRLRAALLDIALGDEPRAASLGTEAMYADVALWTQPGLKHRDFAWDMIVRYRWAAADDEYARVEPIYREIAVRLKRHFDAHLKHIEPAATIWSIPPAPDTAIWTTREALPPPPSPSDFVAMVEQNGVDACVAKVHELRDRDPGLVPFEEDRLLGFVYSWGPDRAEDLLKLLELNRELYPQSAQTQFWIAQVHLAREEPELAKAALKRALELNPEYDKARTLLERLED